MRAVISLVVMLAAVPALGSESQALPKLSAPAYFIAGRTDYRHSREIFLQGTSSLPAGAILTVDIYDYIGEDSRALALRSFPKVGRDGFFEAKLVPLPNLEFKHNIVCVVLFAADYPVQDPSVVKLVGKYGERLGFPTNPQAIVGSGNIVSLELVLHVK